jgi:hypothetical protein
LKYICAILGIWVVSAEVYTVKITYEGEGLTLLVPSEFVCHHSFFPLFETWTLTVVISD